MRDIEKNKRIYKDIKVLVEKRVDQNEFQDFTSFLLAHVFSFTDYDEHTEKTFDYIKDILIKHVKEKRMKHKAQGKK